MSNDAISRRRCIEVAGATTGSVALNTMTSRASGSAIGANERIRFGVIGCGGMGTGHVGSLTGRSEKDNVKVVAVSDVYKRRITRAAGVCGGEGYPDYRKLLENKEIDAVLIATPDHWHGKIAEDALEAGKHVYCEKPMTHTTDQAIHLRNVARRHPKQALQIGPNATSDDAFWKAHEAIKAGRIGKVTWAQSSYNRNARVCLFNTHQRIDPTAGRDKTGEDFIDWDMWLGHRWGLAPKIPWNPEHFFRFRKYWPYNGGVATDLLYHRLAPLLIAIAGPDGAYPAHVNAVGGQYIEKDGRDIPDTFLLTIDYPQEFSILLVSTLTNDSSLPTRVYGKYGTLDLDDLSLRANGDMTYEFKAANDGKTEAKLVRGERRDMEGNFIDVIRSGRTGDLNCNVELGASTMVAIKMGVEAYRQRKTMVWSGAREKMEHA